MNQIVRVKYGIKGETREGYFIETKMGFLPVRISSGEFHILTKEDIISKEKVSVNKITGKLK